MKSQSFDTDLRHLAVAAKVLGHPARLAVLRYLAQCRMCVTGDISEHIPLSRATVFQHLQELKQCGLIQGEIDGVKVHYCLNKSGIDALMAQFGAFFSELQGNTEKNC